MSLLRPVGYVIGLLVSALGATMLLPFLLDVISGNGDWRSFALAGTVTMVAGVMLVLACSTGRTPVLDVRQTFILTTATWVVLPLFGALPFWLGEAGASFTDAFFEAMSGMTTTGSTIFTDLEGLPPGTHLWRGMLQWFGGIGIIVVAMAFLPSLRIGGMQIFRSEGFDTFGKILPRAVEIAGSISAIYLTLTAVCFLAYLGVGMSPLDAVVHAMTTIATGGFSTHDASFAAFPAGAEYVAVLFMLLASLPFVRYVQLLNGGVMPIVSDAQVRGFFATVAVTVVMLVAWLMLSEGWVIEEALRKGLFNGVSILTGTGYASADYMLWGAFPVVLLFLVGLVGGCAGSTCCSIKIFRFQLLVAAIVSQVRQVVSPRGVFTPRYDGRPVAADVMSSVMAFFVLFAVTVAVVSITLSLMGLDTITSVSGAVTAVANIGPGLGPEIGPAGNFAALPDGAKWVLAAAMLVGRLELMSVYVLFTLRFWRG
ncbi:MAG: TrkH family potassium uptake protein [Pseudomonadota bacterium]